MADFSHVSSGQSLAKSPARSAGWLNAVSDAARYHQRQIAGGEASSATKTKLPSTTKPKVKNLTGGNLERGHVVQLGDYSIDEVNHRKLWFEGNTYDKSKKEKIAIVRMAMKPNGIKEAQLIGLCTAIVNVKDAEHRRAKPVDGQKVLESASSGPVEILSPVTSTGEQEVAAFIGGASASITGGFGLPKKNIPAAEDPDENDEQVNGIAEAAVRVGKMEADGRIVPDTENYPDLLLGVNPAPTEIKNGFCYLRGDVIEIDGTEMFVFDNYDSRADPGFGLGNPQITYHEGGQRGRKWGGTECP